MTEIYLEKFRALVPKYLDRPWREEDGLAAGDLDRMLAEHDFTIPLVMREFYLAVGGCADLMEAYNYFWDPDELEVEDGYLMFLEDGDESVTWGLDAAQLELPDPIVFSRDNEDGEWESEEGTFSEFVLDMFQWVFYGEDEE
ncbi:hypothetical protein KIH31_01335 [Paenarthrobacter sp. DKR-5]|uniref:hypothetical protein n=1 Tax=Paenarthrobacter sp. DKR-5 TaxID=2835535 RepID=UPI001BDBD93D|nr:hypothetical protein [Paenarthrobacter sp. DKR-5]MBT1001231.1 hypothetical protein [Paenarthrobacter sp. DKR-5]